MEELVRLNISHDKKFDCVIELLRSIDNSLKLLQNIPSNTNHGHVSQILPVNNIIELRGPKVAEQQKLWENRTTENEKKREEKNQQRKICIEDENEKRRKEQEQEEQRRKIAEDERRKAEEQQRIAAAQRRKAEEAQRRKEQEERNVEEQRRQEEQRMAAERRKEAEEAQRRKEQEERSAEERRRQEEQRMAAERRKAEEAQLRKQQEERIAEERKRQEEQRRAAQKREEEEKRRMEEENTRKQQEVQQKITATVRRKSIRDRISIFEQRAAEHQNQIVIPKCQQTQTREKKREELRECSACLADTVKSNFKCRNESCNTRNWCENCVCTFFSNKINERKPVVCDCMRTLEYIELRMAKIPEEVLSRYNESKTTEFLQDSRVLYCPTCASLQAPGGQTIMTCRTLSCGAKICVRHESQALKNSEFCCAIGMQEATSPQLSANFIQSQTKPCPSCKVSIQKDGGCNHMTCRCGYEFFWCCSRAFRNEEQARMHRQQCP